MALDDANNTYEPLASACAVLRLVAPAIAALSHVVSSVSACLDYSVRYSLQDAVERQDVRLLRRLVAESKRYPSLLPSTLSPTPSRSFTLSLLQSLSSLARRYPRFLTFHVNDAALVAATHGSIEMLELLSQMNPHSVARDQVFDEATYRGHAYVLEWMRKRFVCDDDNCTEAGGRDEDEDVEEADSSRFDTAVTSGTNAVARVHVDFSLWLRWPPFSQTLEGGHTSVALWFMQQLRQRQDTYELNRLLGSAVACGNWTIVEALSDLVTEALSPLATVKLAGRGDLQMIEWLDARAPVRVEGSAVITAAAGGHLHVLEWLVTHRDMACPSGASHAAAANGHLEVLQWLYRRMQAPISPLTFADDVTAAARHGHLDIVKYIDEHCSSAWTIKTMVDSAAINGHLDVVKWLHERFGSVECSIAAMDKAAINGHLAVVQWLHDHNVGSCTSDAMDSAAANGHLDVVKWLHTHRTDGCTTDAMHSAAMNGHLHVVQWLHAHRREGRVSTTLERTAANGHLDVVKWLYAHRSTSCRRPWMNIPAYADHVDMLQQLHASTCETCSPRAIGFAISSGHVDVVQWLFEHGSAHEFTPAMAAAAALGHFDKLWFLYLVGLESATLQQQAVSVANFHWLYETLPQFCDLDRFRPLIRRSQRADLIEWLADIGELGDDRVE